MSVVRFAHLDTHTGALRPTFLHASSRLGPQAHNATLHHLEPKLLPFYYYEKFFFHSNGFIPESSLLARWLVFGSLPRLHFPHTIFDSGKRNLRESSQGVVCACECDYAAAIVENLNRFGIVDLLILIWMLDVECVVKHSPRAHTSSSARCRAPNKHTFCRQ